MESFLSWTNSLATWFVNLPVGWQMLIALLIVLPLCFVLARYLILPIIDAVQLAYRRRVDHLNTIEPRGDLPPGSDGGTPTHS